MVSLDGDHDGQVDLATHAELSQLSADEGVTMRQTVRDAAEELRRQRLARQVPAQMTALRSSPARWSAYLADAEATAVPDGVDDELWLVDFGDPFPGETAHHRPALILGPPESFGPDFPFVIVGPLTATRRGLTLHVEVEPSDTNGPDRTSYVQCELVRSINGRRLVRRLGTLDPASSRHVGSIVRTLLEH